MLQEIEAFGSVERRRVFHQAFEARLHSQALDAVALHHAAQGATSKPPKFQAVFCIDEREESVRRHLEEVCPEAETFGTAGFFCVAMNYRGASDAHFVPLCPIVIQPQHWVEERVADEHQEIHEQRARWRRLLGAAIHSFQAGSRTFSLGALLSAGLGVLTTIPLVSRVLFPRLTAHWLRRMQRIVQAPTRTRLSLERTEPGEHAGPHPLGFTIQEMIAMAGRFLRDIGLTANHSRLVLILGHGSTSLNNPHKSAYDCGACGGSAGGPNARAMATMLNDPRVREGLAHEGLTIPTETVFVGGMHNTCSEDIQLFDVRRVPASHRDLLADAQRVLEQALERNAHERSRRFESAPLSITPAAARLHTQARSEDLAQVRPELGHATNAICIVARRQRTSGLYLDRRAFLVSYDPTQDDATQSILQRTLGAVVPVCAGINLEYYFSTVDSPGWGCGSKLPHNITALLGVMDGAASDLRTGLPWQMVEIHEPVRLLFVIETRPEHMLAILQRNAGIQRLVDNEWVRLAILDPDSSRMWVLTRGQFLPYAPQASHLPTAASSVDWYRGWREHLDFAEIVG